MFIDELARAALTFLAVIWIFQGLSEHRQDRRWKRWYDQTGEFSDPPPDWTPPPRPSRAYSTGHTIGVGLMTVVDAFLHRWCAQFHGGSHSPSGHCVKCGRTVN